MKIPAHISASHRTLLVGTASLVLATPAAHAHHAMGGATPDTLAQGLLSGIAHPVIGLDHLAFLLVAALLSAMLTGRGRYLVPLAFVVGTVAGTLHHLGAADLPMTETVIALSVLLGGLTVVLRHSLPALLLGGLFGVIGVFHGYAYGESIVGAESTPLLSYLAGFALIQFAIIVGGVKALDAVARHSPQLQAGVVRYTGLAAAATGALFLGMNIA
ncbi:MAG: HupE/UreJ family protein [Sedimenticolaceae bacterium]